nr:23S rRNA (adenine(2503)-C(2))-methyltransferase RlmN [bacterium]
MSALPCLLEKNREELARYVTGLGQPAYRASQLEKWLWMGTPIEGMANLPKSFREQLLQGPAALAAGILKEHRAGDGTVKYLFGMPDGECVEGVWMHYHHGDTMCVSTQAGCRMGCAFCASTMSGLARNLSAGEMASMVVAASAAQREEAAAKGGQAGLRMADNLVLMGSGEPLDNYEQVIGFLRLMARPEGFGMSMRNISL